jgi:hypothetical protein
MHIKIIYMQVLCIDYITNILSKFMCINFFNNTKVMYISFVYHKNYTHNFCTLLKLC